MTHPPRRSVVYANLAAEACRESNGFLRAAVAAVTNQKHRAYLADANAALDEAERLFEMASEAERAENLALARIARATSHAGVWS